MRKLALAWALALAAGAGYGWWSAPGPTRLVFLAVGQGDCTVFQTGGTAMLVDVGPRNDKFDAGERIVLPRLEGLGISRVSFVVLSHPDIDHVGGLPAVARRFPEVTVAVSSCFRSHPGMLQTLQDAHIDERHILWLGPESEAHIGAFVLHFSSPLWKAPANDNDGSVFIRLSNGIDSAVLSGDASADTEQAEMPGHEWKAQIMKAGHHGSRTANCESWLEAVHPIWAVITCGRDNRYGHPHRETLERFEKDGIKVARTDLEGDIEFDAGPHGFTRAGP